MGGDAYHGRGGLLNVKNLDHYNPLVDILIEAAAQLQFPYNNDFNGVEQEGFGRRQVTQRNGWRESSATAFLKSALRRPNLIVITNAVASRLTFDGQKATGVEIRRDGQSSRIAAKREMIVSAGAIASPALLLRSGIGDAAKLKELGLPVIRHAPAVGANLQDHMAAAIRYSSPSTLPYGLSWKTVPWVARSVFEYLLFRRGLLANNILHAGGFVRTDPSLDRPDVQFILVPANYTPSGRMGIGHGQHANTIFHPVGTCRMGPNSEAVVDPQLRVRDVDGLRIVDVSIMPNIIGGNTNAPAMMIAEKASDMILGHAPLISAELRNAV